MREARSFAAAGRSRGSYRGTGGYRGSGGYRGYNRGRGGYKQPFQSQSHSSDLEVAIAKLLSRGGASQSMRNTGGSSKTLRCFKCNETSHLAKQCPN